MPGASVPFPQPLDEPLTIELLTQQALEASRAGDWDRVMACYANRQVLLQGGRLDRIPVQLILDMDEQVRAAALVAQAAISSLIADNTHIQVQLRRLRESAGHQPAIQGSIHREA